MAQRQWRSDDTDKWLEAFGDGSSDVTKSADETASLANATCTGTVASKTLTLGAASTFANGDIVLIHQTQKATGSGVYELNKIVSGASTTTLTMKYDLMNTYAAKAQIVGFVKAKNFTINSGKTVTVPAWDGSIGSIYPVLANGDITVTGNITGSNKGFRGGAAVGSLTAGYQGESGVGTGTQSQNANGAGGGGGVDTSSNGGGGGGYATAGVNNGNNGVDGEAFGNAGLTLLAFGGGGGGGAGGGGENGEAGGLSGGVVFLIGKSITITGSISSLGETKSQNLISTDPGGGGAGGSVLLKGKTIILGTALITATGGTGGYYPGQGRHGGNGSVGRIHADYSTSITGTTTPTIDSTQDATIIESGGGSFFAFL